jgi:hypothetical protein
LTAPNLALAGWAFCAQLAHRVTAKARAKPAGVHRSVAPANAFDRPAHLCNRRSAFYRTQKSPAGRQGSKKVSKQSISASD